MFLYCCIVLYCTILFNVGIVLYCIVLYYIILHLLYCIVLYYTVLHCIALYCILLYYTVLCCIVSLCCTVLYMVFFTIYCIIWFIVNGGFTSWTNEGTCTRTCDVGQQRQTRACTNPAPAHGGMSCTGDTTRMVNCSIRACAGECLSRILVREYF